MKQEQRMQQLKETTVIRYRPKAQPTLRAPWRRVRRMGRHYCRWMKMQ